jgi:hypothetical protein
MSSTLERISLAQRSESSNPQQTSPSTAGKNSAGKRARIAAAQQTAASDIRGELQHSKSVGSTHPISEVRRK